MDGDAPLAVQPEESLHGPVCGLSEQREAHQEAARSVLLPTGTLVVLQGLVEPVLELLQRVRTVQWVGI